MGGFNGLGTYVRFYNWVQDRNNGIKILASRMDTEMDGFATGLSTCITIDGQSTPTANISLANNKITLLAGATLVTDAMNLGQSRTGSAEYASASGGPTGAYAAGFSPPLTAVSDGTKVSVYFGASNSTSATATFNPDSLGAANILKASGAVLAKNDIKVGVGTLTRYGSGWYYTPPLAPAGPFGLADGGIISYGSTGGTAENNTAYLVDASSTVQFVKLSSSPSTGDMVPLTIFGTNNTKLWASGLLIKGSTSTVDTGGTEGLAIPRYTGTTRGWVW